METKFDKEKFKAAIAHGVNIDEAIEIATGKEEDRKIIEAENRVVEAFANYFKTIDLDMSESDLNDLREEILKNLRMLSKEIAPIIRLKRAFKTRKPEMSGYPRPQRSNPELHEVKDPEEAAELIKEFLKR